MTRKCPPGVICFENITLVLFLIIACVIIYLAYSQYNRDGSNSSKSSSVGSNIINRRDYNNDGDAMVGGFLNLIPNLILVFYKICKYLQIYFNFTLIILVNYLIL